VIDRYTQKVSVPVVKSRFLDALVESATKKNLHIPPFHQLTEGKSLRRQKEEGEEDLLISFSRFIHGFPPREKAVNLLGIPGSIDQEVVRFVDCQISPHVNFCIYQIPLNREFLRNFYCGYFACSLETWHDVMVSEAFLVNRCKELVSYIESVDLTCANRRVEAMEKRRRDSLLSITEMTATHNLS
jgi:hypothetical protein